MCKPRQLRQLGLIVCALLGTSAHANDLDALELADKAGSQVQQARSWRLFLEGAFSQANSRITGDSGHTSRAAVDFRLDSRLNDSWRAVLSNRLDLVDAKDAGGAESVNTLREAFLSWSAGADWAIDLGRVNLRNGSAMGYNPTDWFKEDALRAAFNADPAALRENRQGTVVLQLQKLWSQGSISLAASPKLGDGPSTRAHSLNVGATNPRDRWLVVGSVKLSDAFSPQLLAHGGEGVPVQWGLNLSGLLGQATVAFAEWSGGRGPSLTARALATPTVDRHVQRSAIGLTHTLPFNLSFTLEAEHNSSGMSRSDWSSLAGTPGAQLAVLAAAQSWQDLPSRQAWFVHLRWKDAALLRLELSGYLRREASTQSSAAWLEARYRWDQADLALQWQGFLGPRGSIFGSVPNRRAVELALRYYL